MQNKSMIAVLGVVALAVSACGSGSSGAGGGNGGGSSSGKKHAITLIAGTTNDNFYVTMNCGAKAEAAKQGVTYKFTGPSSFDASQQTPIVNSVTADHPDAVLIAPTDSTALIAPMKQMKAQGIKVVEVDTTVSDNSIAVSQISSDNELGGKDAADALAKQIGGKGTVMVVNVNPGISTTDARDKGFKEEMKAKYPHVKVLQTQYDGDKPSKAASIITSTYAAHPDLNGVFAANVLTAEGVATGIKEAHATGKIKNISFDAEPSDISALKKGVIDALVAQEPALIGKDGIDQALNSLNGKPVTKKIATKLVTITKGNLSSMKKYIYKSHC
ncbi:MAG: ABC transporter substrate-binding protein [Marmoricola sp.]